jgi:hypothetical protein
MKTKMNASLFGASPIDQIHSDTQRNKDCHSRFIYIFININAILALEKRFRTSERKMARHQCRRKIEACQNTIPITSDKFHPVNRESAKMTDYLNDKTRTLKSMWRPLTTVGKQIMPSQLDGGNNSNQFKVFGLR